MQFFDSLISPIKTRDHPVKNTACDVRLNIFFALTYGLGVSALLDPLIDLVSKGIFTFSGNTLIPLATVFCMYLAVQPDNTYIGKIYCAIADVMNIVGYTCILPTITALIHIMGVQTVSSVTLIGCIAGLASSWCVFYIKNLIFEQYRR